MSRFARHQAGLSMIEVLVVVFVMAIGLLGLGALQTVSLSFAQGARQKTQATNLAYEIIDIMRSNTPNAGYFAATGWTATCAVNSAPTYQCDSGEQAVRCDMNRWSQRVCSQLPGGRGRLSISPAVGRGTSMAMTVDVCWQDRIGTGTSGTANCTGTDETLFTVETQL